MVSLIRGILGMALKTNDSLQFAVLTGCLRISKNIDGGVAPFLIYTIVIAGGLAAGYVFGYFGG